MTASKKLGNGNPHDLLAFIMRYLVVPLPKKEVIISKSGELEERVETKNQSAILQEISSSIDSIIKQNLPTDQSIKVNQLRVTKSEMSYSFSRKIRQTKNYSVSLRYHSTSDHESIDVTITQDSESLTEDIITKTSRKKEQKLYSFSIQRRKELHEQKGYEVHLSYDYLKGVEQATVEYRAVGYTEQILAQKSDFSERVPFKVLHMKPKNTMGGALGYTYLGESFMALRDDLIGSLKKEVDIHESIHTPDEYETRVLTWWMMEKPKQYERK